MNDEQLAAVSDESYFDSWRVWCAFIDGGESVERDGILIARTGAPAPWLNIAFVTRRLDSPNAAIDWAVRYFDERRTPFVIRVREGIDPDAERAAEALGIEYSDTVPGMTLSPIAERPELPPGLQVRPVGDEAELKDFITVSAEAFGMPAGPLSQLVTMRLLKESDSRAYTGYVDGQPVCASMLIITRRIAGIYFVGTLESYRKRGLGEAMTWHAVAEGAKAGCTVSALQASDLGKPVYERMGFRVVSPYRTFVHKQ